MWEVRIVRLIMIARHHHKVVSVKGGQTDIGCTRRLPQWHGGGFDHNLQCDPTFVVVPPCEELERVLCVLETKSVGDEFLDVRECVRAEELEGGGVGVGVAERAQDIDFAGLCGRDREDDVARAHTDEHHFPACDRSLDERY